MTGTTGQKQETALGIMRRVDILLLQAIIAMLALLSGCAGRAVHPERSDQLAISRMTEDLRQARVIFAAEFHNRRDHHTLQMEIIRSQHDSDAPLAIGLEMFDIEKQPVLDEWVRGTVPLQEFVAAYSKGWSINWAEYDEILMFARNNRIPLIALDAPPDLVRTVTYGGEQALTQKTRQRLPAGVTTRISSSYRKFMSRAFGGHEIPEAFFDNFCAAQGLRNSTMALRIAGYLAAEPARRMVVIAGVGHAMRRAVPAALAGTGLTAKIVIPHVDGLSGELDGDDMDYFVEP